ncbi:MAG: M14 family zinc carboxypeptidase, partial [Flavobacterium sp.]
MNRIFAAISVCILFFSQGISQVKSPESFLPNFGKTVTYYHQVEDYFKHLTTNSKNIQHLQYGVTPQERALNVYFISDEENLKNLEIHKNNHLYEIGLFPTKNTSVSDKNVLWLSFNVHGNEIGSIESSLKIAYELLNNENIKTQTWLQDNIIILDPCLNPDGFSRYANWLRDISGSKTHPGLADREHMEPWPGGRQNHYVFDLNRDWAWQTQPESQLRMDLYHQWMPMIHADVHEMGYNEPYFFPPAAEPLHEQISDFQRDFHKKVGELTSKKFDKEGWLYYSGERFDLFYPSYGDTYPSFNGAVGMTYEQGGIGAGRAVQMKNGEILTIQDRIDHHATAILAVIELSQVMKDELRKNFRDYFKQSRQKPKGVYQTYVIKNNPKNLELLKLLNRNRIEANFANETRKLSGYHYQSDKNKNFIVEPDDLIIQTDQPRAVLTQVLMEPHHKLTDSLSYDITAWALPLAYGVEAYALKNKTSFQTKTSVIRLLDEQPSEIVYAFYVPWNNRTSAKILSQLHQQKIKTRFCQKPVKVGGISLERGTLIITKADNTSIENFESKLSSILKQKSDFGI